LFREIVFMPKLFRFMRFVAIGHAIAVCPAIAQTDGHRFETSVRPILAKQCFQCHGDKLQTAAVDFSVFPDNKSAAQNPELWRKVREKVSNRLMPPPPLPSLSAADAAAITGWIDSFSHRQSGLRFRQHRRCAHALTDADGKVHGGGAVRFADRGLRGAV
jgi:hypothetical protein